MLDDDEVLVSTEETGYRLCAAAARGAVAPVDGSRAVVESMSIFSVTFDSNNPNRMFICYQDGTLKLCDTDTHRLEAYQIVFKKSTSAYDLTPSDAANEKVVTTHWDKLVSIPNRPDELIFLLGISRNLMYTALPPPVDAPYSSPPFLRKSSRSDIPGFFYGSPIMEISVHRARVTSLSVNASGSLLASGDESGRIRIILLRLFDQLSSRNAITSSSNQSSSSSSSSRMVAEHRPTFSMIFTAHCDVPVFSLEWLPIELLPQEDDSSLPVRHALASGSMDRSVRVWTICCSPKSGISVQPAFILDTLSTHILTMTSLLHVDTAVRAKILAVDELLRTRNTLSSGDRWTASPSSSRASPSSVASPPRDIASVDRTMRLDKANSVYLACGTNAGTLYIWKMDFEALRQRLLLPAAAAAAAAGPATGGQKLLSFGASDFTRDSSISMLYSLLQASDRPLIHVSMAGGQSGCRPSTGSGTLLTSLTAASSSSQEEECSDFLAEGMMDAASPGRVLLVCSDTQGVARIYCSDVIGADLPSSQYSADDDDTPPLHNLALYEQYRRVMSHVDAHNNLNMLHPLIKVGEQSYQNAVVACRFQQKSRSSSREDGSVSAAVGNGSPDCVSSVPPGALMVKSLMVALARGEVFMYDAMGDWTRFAARLQVKEIPSSDAFSVIRKVLSPHTPADDVPSPSSSGSDVEHQQHQHHLHDVLAVRSRASSSPKLPGRISFSSNNSRSPPPPPPSHYSRSPSGASVTCDDDNAQPLGVHQSKKMSKGASSSSRFKTDDVDAEEEEEEEEEVSDAMMTMLPRALPPPAPTPPMVSSTSRPGEEARRCQVADRRRPLVSKAKTNSAMSDRSAAPPSTSAPPSTIAPPSIGAPDSSDHSAYYRNDFGMPSMTHSKVLEQKLRNITSQLAHDEISVSSLNTTQSDRYAASKAVLSTDSSCARRRYGPLTPVDAQQLLYPDQQALRRALADKQQRQQRTGKQVDPAWLQHRKYGGPTEQSLALLDIPDPVVELGFNTHCISSSPVDIDHHPDETAAAAARKSYKAAKHGVPMTPLQRFVYNSDYGLHCSTDPSTLLPRYRLEVNVQQLFGDVYQQQQHGDSNRRVRDELRKLERDRLLDLTSPSSFIT